MTAVKPPESPCVCPLTYIPENIELVRVRLPSLRYVIYACAKADVWIWGTSSFCVWFPPFQAAVWGEWVYATSSSLPFLCAYSSMWIRLPKVNSFPAHGSVRYIAWRSIRSDRCDTYWYFRSKFLNGAHTKRSSQPIPNYLSLTAPASTTTSRYFLSSFRRYRAGGTADYPLIYLYSFPIIKFSFIIFHLRRSVFKGTVPVCLRRGWDLTKAAYSYARGYISPGKSLMDKRYNLLLSGVETSTSACTNLGIFAIFE